MSYVAAIPDGVGETPVLCDEVEALIAALAKDLSLPVANVAKVRYFALKVQIETVRHYAPDALPKCSSGDTDE